MLSSNTSAANGAANYIEDVFSTWLYTGNNSTQDITNGIDLSTKGGLVWVKRRDAEQHFLADTARGVNKIVKTDSTAAAVDTSGNPSVTAFLTNGFSLGANSATNGSSATPGIASWTFRKQPKFYTQGTFTGNGANRTISHDLGSAPGMIIVKRTDSIAPWVVYHRSLGATKYIFLNATSFASTGSTYWNNTDPTSTVFSLGTEADINGSGGTFVYYAFAHDAGGFGLTGTDNVVSCGTFTTNASSVANVNLGYEPQWILSKSSTQNDSWRITDNMRGWNVALASKDIYANGQNAESGGYSDFYPTATGFQVTREASQTYIYIAIRRGPMKVPTDATKVFKPVARTGTGTDTTITGVGFAPDTVVSKTRGVGPPTWWDKLRGAYPWIKSSDTGAEGTTTTNALLSYTNDGVNVGTDGSQGNINYSGFNYATYFLVRAPSFFDEVCYKGNDTDMTLNHNLGVAPELMIVKRRSASGGWFVYSAGTTTPSNYYLQLQSTAAQANAGSQVWNNTSTTFLAGTGLGLSSAGQTYVAYLFATCAGVSKVGSYTGTGTTKQVDCGFAAGARFVLIKRTDSTGDWYVWDTARGIVSGNDPYLLLNSTAAETTTTDYIDPYSAGFELSSTAPAALNASGGTYIFLAIA